MVDKNCACVNIKYIKIWYILQTVKDRDKKNQHLTDTRAVQTENTYTEGCVVINIKNMRPDF